MEIIIKINIDGNEVKDVKVETEKEVATKDAESNNYSVSDYARFFNECCVGWTKNPEYNLMFLIAQQNYVNDMLKSKGHLFLNEVYDLFGIPRTKAGQIVGWVYNEKDPHSISFGIYDKQNENFVNGCETNALLDFNVDGNILDYI